MRSLKVRLVSPNSTWWIDAMAMDHVAYMIPNMADATFPTGTAMIR